MTVESALFRSFDRMVHSQLDPIWHRVSPKTRLLTSDLTTLRSLLTYLVTLDSVSFYRFLETLLEAQSEHGGSVVGAVKRDRSPWLFMDAADTVFSVARKRVFTPKPRSVTSTSTSASAAGQDGPEPEEGEFEKYLDQGGPTEEEEQAMREEYEAEEAAIQAASAAGFDVSGFRTPSKPASTTNTNTAAKTNTGGKTREEREGEAVVKKWLEPKGLEATLEELPKWALLKEVLAEIEDQIWRNPRTESASALRFPGFLIFSRGKGLMRCGGNSDQRHDPHHVFVRLDLRDHQRIPLLGLFLPPLRSRRRRHSRRGGLDKGGPESYDAEVGRVLLLEKRLGQNGEEPSFWSYRIRVQTRIQHVTSSSTSSLSPRRRGFRYKYRRRRYGTDQRRAQAERPMEARPGAVAQAQTGERRWSGGSEWRGSWGGRDRKGVRYQRFGNGGG